MRHLTRSLAFVLIAALATDAAAQRPEKDRAASPEANEDGTTGPPRNRPDRPRPGRPGFRGQGFQGQGFQGQGNGAPNRDPAQMVARMMRQFDKDGDKKLDETELTEMFATMQRRGGPRGMMRQDGRPGRPGEAGPRRRRPDQERPASPGGEKPQRPPAEE